MTRWKPDGRERLEKAAMELFLARGYTETTVQEIAAEAGLTERTFFRYFSDKREVLFWGAPMLQKLIVDGIAAAPKSTPPLEAVVAALESTGPMFKNRKEYARSRRGLMNAHPELRERELIKMAMLASAAGQALRQRGVKQPAANLAAQSGITLFSLAFDRWLDAKSGDLARHLRDSLAALRGVVTASAR